MISISSSALSRFFDANATDEDEDMILRRYYDEVEVGKKNVLGASVQ